MSRPPVFLDLDASLATFEREANFLLDHRGATIWKLPQDLDRYRCVIETTKPDVLVECGTKWGGFAAWVADTFKVQVVTIDTQSPEGRPASWPGVTFVRGNTVDGTLRLRVAELIPAGSRVMVSLDSDHSAPHVRAEIAAYGPLVSPGCYLVVEDGIADLAPSAQRFLWGDRVRRSGGPLLAIERALVGDSRWERDEVVERMSPVTHNPAGWWRRA